MSPSTCSTVRYAKLVSHGWHVVCTAKVYYLLPHQGGSRGGTDWAGTLAGGSWRPGGRPPLVAGYRPAVERQNDSVSSGKSTPSTGATVRSVTLVSHGVDVVCTYLARGGRLLRPERHFGVVRMRHKPLPHRRTLVLRSSLCAIFEHHSFHHLNTSRLSVQINPI